MHHTPGPWKAYTLPNGSHHIIADHWNASIATTMYPESGSEGREANARLIAAAPDLLMALENLLKVVGVRIDDPRIEQFDAARAAINKATGE